MPAMTWQLNTSGGVSQEPSLDEAQKVFEGDAAFTKVNIDQNQKVAVKLGIQSIPTLIVFKS